MTKQEVRAAALAKLAVRPTDTLWDVGAGSGSVSVELALAAPRGHVYAVECAPDACALIRQNREKFHAYNLSLIEGTAPQVLADLPAPDAVFIGGTKGEMDAVVAAALAKNPAARLCISAIALETLSAAVAALRRLVELSGSQGLWLLRRLEGEKVTETRALTEGEAPELAAYLKDATLFQDGILTIPVSRPGTVWLFGGGHVSQALAAVLAPLDFRVAVYDDRPEFTGEDRFPLAVKRVAAPFGELRRHVPLGPDDYLVIMTRGHQADFEVLRETLRAPVRYLGCIGSRRKLAICRDRLLAEGFTEAEYARLHAPIGLAIGAETPEEIAVSIAAELIAVRAGKLA